MKKTTKVLIVDDSALIRQLLKKALEKEEAIEVVATAANGLIALEKIKIYSPDLVLLDIEMPEMNGMETLAHIAKDYPKIRVIMCSSLTEAGCQITLDCLAMGAHDYISKPSSLNKLTVNSGDVKLSFEQELLQKVSSFFYEEEPQPTMQGVSEALASINPIRQIKPGRIEAVLIGISTGGPDALMKLIKQFPKDFPVPILIVQHMPALFTRLLAERINSFSAIDVCEASDGQKIKASTVYIAPGDHHMVVKKTLGVSYISLTEEPPVNYSRPSVDVLFDSAAKTYQKNCLAVVMTGMGHDGLEGCKLIKARGGQIFTQDKASSVVWGMPGAVTKAELADQVIALDDMYKVIASTVEKSHKND